MRLITGAIRSTPTYCLAYRTEQHQPPAICRTQALLREHQLPVQEYIPTLRQNRVRSRNPPLWQAEQLAVNNVDIRNLWAQHYRVVVNPKEREWFESYNFDTAGTELHRKLWVKLNRTRTGHGRCADSLFRCGAVESPRCDCGTPN
ncbi:hypothetical protein HUJ05_009795 [Dendroctonus ponderosae]|nr:hypothetical protein HUJ05_009795 [Dendroctonus ponderosae]